MNIKQQNLQALHLGPGGTVLALLAPAVAAACAPGVGRGQMGSALMGSLDFVFMFFDGGTFWVLPLTYFIFPKVPGCACFPNRSKSITFAAAPLVSTPLVQKPKAAG